MNTYKEVDSNDPYRPTLLFKGRWETIKRLIKRINDGFDFTKIDWFYYFGVPDYGELCFLKQAFGIYKENYLGDKVSFDEIYQVEILNLIEKDYKLTTRHKGDWMRVNKRLEEGEKVEELIDSLRKEIAELQLDKVNEEAVKQTEQSEPEQKVEPQQPSVVINESELEQFFKYDLRRKGFYEILIERLNEAANKLHYTDMDYARIAYLLFKSPHFLKPKSNYKFTEWYKAFCNIVGCKYHDTFYPSTLRRNQDALEKMFNSFCFLDVPIEKVK